MCGNYIQSLPRADRVGGSPPRVRELLNGRGIHGHAQGITPACAGITAISLPIKACMQDHPRVCGNYPISRNSTSTAAGSPPRVRELRLDKLIAVFVRRITPACAGITLCSFIRLSYFKDHPRVCGNYAHPHNLRSNPEGSPPRVRELLTVPAILKGKYRITPACAGITSNSSACLISSKDHPRVCGNYTEIMFFFVFQGDHPRVCGNYQFWQFRIFFRQGSPPRVRELPKDTLLDEAVRRITPACAGITNVQSGIPQNTRDHPRVCGNY